MVFSWVDGELCWMVMGRASDQVKELEWPIFHAVLPADETKKVRGGHSELSQSLLGEVVTPIRGALAQAGPASGWRSKMVP